MLAIAGGKGGTGKTTTTLGLAAALDRPVLAVDADADMPNLHALAGLGPETDPTAPESATGPVPGVRPHPEHPDVSILPAPGVGKRSDADQSNSFDRRGRPGRRDTDMQRRLARVRSAVAGTDYRVLVDCPAGAAPDAAAPLRAADGVLLVSTLCAAALRDTAKTAAMARAVGTPIVGAVLTRTRLAPSAVSDLLGCSVLASVPDVNPPVLGNRTVRASYAQLAVETQPKT